MDRTPEEEAEVKAMQDEILKPPPSAWSDEPPYWKMNGWFWFRVDSEMHPIIVLLSGGIVHSVMKIYGHDSTTVKHWPKGQWQPVAPPLA